MGLQRLGNTIGHWPKHRVVPWYRWARSRNGRAPAGFRPNGLPFGRQSRCHRWARSRNGRTPARFRPNGLPFGRQSRCRLAPSNPLKAKMDGAAKAWQHHWALAQATSGTKVPVGTQPKRQNPSKIQAKRVAIWSAEPVPFGTFEPAKSKDRWGWALA